MNVALGVWNVLHDGSIVDVAGSVPGEVTVTVAIEYLRSLFPGSGDRFLIHLSGCSMCELRRFLADQTLVGDLTTVAAEEPEILSADFRENTVVVSMTVGPGSYLELHLLYENLCVALEDGQPVTIEELADAAQRYWERFGEDT